MAGPYAHVPIGQAIKSSFLWAAAVARRHPEGLVATMLAVLVLSIIPVVGPLLAAISIIPLIMVTHNEVIRGPAGFDSTALGPGWRRVLRFFLDEMVLGLILMGVYLVPVLVVILLAAALDTKENPLVALVLSIPLMGVAAFVMVGTMRLTLRFPSRSIDAALRWREAWAIGRGHTFRLIVASSVIGLPVMVLWGAITLATLGSLFGQWLFLGLVAPLQVVLHSSFLALAYMHCMTDFQNRRQEPASAR